MCIKAAEGACLTAIVPACESVLRASTVPWLSRPVQGCACQPLHAPESEPGSGVGFGVLLIPGENGSVSFLAVGVADLLASNKNLFS